MRAISTPAASRSAAARWPRSSTVSTTARSAGLIEKPFTSRRTASGSITPMRSLPGEDERLLDDPARDDHALGAVLDQQVAVGHGHHALLEEPDRNRGSENLHSRVDRGATKLGSRPDPVAIGEERSSDVIALVDHDDRVARLRCGDRGLETGLAAADHGDVGVPVLDVDALLARAVRVERPEARGAAQELLVERPELAWAG